jgi:hypothetical protein
VFDRDGIDVGVKVTDGPKVGHVKRKRVLVTVSLNESPNVVLDNIPAELLVRATVCINSFSKLSTEFR